MQESWELHWKDYFKILQVDPSAEPEVVKGAYDRLARKYHPDVNKDTNAIKRMKELNEAFEVLGDPSKRASYYSAYLKRHTKSSVTLESAKSSSVRMEQSATTDSNLAASRRVRIPIGVKIAISVCAYVLVVCVTAITHMSQASFLLLLVVTGALAALWWKELGPKKR